MDKMIDIIGIFTISGILVMLSCMAFYELMYLTWGKMDKVKFSHRYKILMTLAAIFFAHTVTVIIYGVIYYLLMKNSMGHLFHTSSGVIVKEFSEYIYFSVVTYSSLGMDDVLPSGRIKFISGAEVLNGMVLIAWSASFTYICMEKFWHIRKSK